MLTATLIASVLLIATTASAQQSQRVDLAGLIDSVFDTTQNPILSNPIITTATEVRSLDDARAREQIVAGVLSSAVVLETAAFPIGSSSGAFTYVFDSARGAGIRSSPSFGPAFAERPLTSGRGHLNMGFTYLHRSFEKLEGRGLDDGSLVFHFPLVFRESGRIADMVESRLKLDVSSDTATFFASYGVLSNLDVAVAVPVQHVRLKATVTSQLYRLGTPALLNIPAEEATSDGSASGLGDIAVRAKYNFYNGDGGAIAAGMDLRLPTGDDQNLLGTGTTRTKIYGALGSKMGRLFPHFNIGYTFMAGDPSPLFDPDAGLDEDESANFFYGSEVSYAAGAEFVAHPRLTIVGDLLGRSLANEGRMRQRTDVVPLTDVNVFTGGSSIPILVRATDASVTETYYAPNIRLNSVLTSIGAKFNPGSTFIISAHVLFPVTNAGLRSRPAPVIGVDYTF
jgi:hypothetical protein